METGNCCNNVYTVFAHEYNKQRGDISPRSLKNSEASASEFIKDLEEITSRQYMHIVTSYENYKFRPHGRV